MAHLSAAPGLPLWSDHVQFVRRHRVRLGVLMGLGLMVGAFLSLGQPATYSATASIALTPVPKYVSPATTGLPAAEVTIDTDAQLLNSPPVLDAVAKVLDTDSPSEHLSVTASPSSHVLHVTVTGASPQDAADAADAAVTALAVVRRDALGTLGRGQLRQQRLLLDQQEELLAQAQDKQALLPAGDELFSLVLERHTSLQELEDARAVPLEVMNPAVSPRHPDYPNTEVPLVSGAMVGLLLGCLLGAIRDRKPARRAFPGARPAPHPSDGQPSPDTSHEEYTHAV
jgi:uncharacterized protein involved in exopolysaccharide biosynthesis